ncbi:MAG: efflux RND transporter periplasmic adaptor subunit [Bacteroidetes bacterium]|nr:MAG: efflux RND transporter periplasmic adaptor subunit [Bacteroidota bacterium]
MKRIYIYVFLVLLVLSTGAYFYFKNGSDEDVTYRTEKVSRGEVAIQVRATGTINPVQTVLVGSQVSGTIARITVDFNSVVKKGEILAQIDSTFLNASVKEAEANVERNQAQVNEAKRTVTRTNDLYKKDLVAQSELDAAQTAYESAIAQLKQAQAASDRARVNLRYSTIKSPIDGVVISRDVDVGQTVAASLQAPQLFAIANDLTHMQVEASVDEADIGHIKEGQSVTFSVDSYPEETFSGTVKQVRLAPVVTQNVVTYTVIIEVPNPDLKLRPGMTATVSVLIEKKEDVLRIPSLAIRFQPDEEILKTFSGNSPSFNPNGNGGKEQASAQGKRQQAERKMERNDMRQQGERQDRASGTMKGTEGSQRWGDGQPKKMQKKVSRVWVADGKKGIRPVMVTLGLNDNRYVEVLEGELTEKDEVVIGVQQPETAMGQNQQTNPFAPRMPGGRGGGRGGR